MTTVGPARLALAIGATVAISAIAGGLAVAGPAAGDGEGPPASLVSGEPSRDRARLDTVFAHLKLDRLGAKFSEEKHIALLAKPLRSTGTIYFDRDKGIARTTLTPKPQQVVLTKTSLRIKKENRTEEIALDRSKDLKAFALILPTLLRGDRAELERSFDIGLYGSDRDWWALSFTPRTKSLRALVHDVVVFGRTSALVAVRVSEASGDITNTRLTETVKNGDVPDAEIATAFGAP